MNPPFDQSRFAVVLDCPDPERRGGKFLSYVGDQIREDTWQEFHDDLFAIPSNARRLYLPLCFDIGVRGDGMADAFSFYGHSADSLIVEITEGFRLLGLPQVADLVDLAYRYWKDPASPMHGDSVPWRRMDEDLNDVHGRYFRGTEDLFALVGTLVTEWGEDRIHRSPV
jgi:hypothetical protein